MTTTVLCAPGFEGRSGDQTFGIGTSFCNPAILTSPQIRGAIRLLDFAHIYAILSIPLSRMPTTVCVSLVILAVG